MFTQSLPRFSDSPYRNLRRLSGLGKFKSKRFGRDVLVCGNEEKLLKEFYAGPQGFEAAFRGELSTRIKDSSSFLSPVALACLVPAVIPRDREEWCRRVAARVGELHAVEILKLSEHVVGWFEASSGSSATRSTLLKYLSNRFPSIIGDLRDSECRKLLSVLNDISQATGVPIKDSPSARLTVLKIRAKLASVSSQSNGAL